jgi:hypothetical protein
MEQMRGIIEQIRQILEQIQWYMKQIYTVQEILEANSCVKIIIYLNPFFFNSKSKKNDVHDNVSSSELQIGTATGCIVYIFKLK